ncbi:UDP-2,3-diacylglucosamine diphosphatase [Shewanella sp. WXL01]|uniref:UDP-2,3-diacylglucosamine diphosphatase n=1 Tax=Shewanella sp. WXL01 TaxID=2709721 RepID=UPI00143860C6|nr:UDP-2,3-diacylglucosamine diphosphatase [Shewanella sp. WXL01]NKF51532.1 UDP-2,3-diacylglucosamine diphosphatase [Shewanella sp. WXL01]
MNQVKRQHNSQHQSISQPNSISQKEQTSVSHLPSPFQSTSSCKSNQYHALWISDVHLGTPDCKAEFLLQLLEQAQCDYLYLVGDIVDIWALKRRVYWPEPHQRVLQKIMQIAADTDTQVFYIPGNHDEAFKAYSDSYFRGITIKQEHMHVSKQGKRCLLIHGDQFDSEVGIHPFYAKLGDRLYDVLLWLNRGLHKARSLFGYSYWSLAGYVKQRVSKAQAAINQFKTAALAYGRKQGADLVVCGHIHQPELSHNLINDRAIIYANDGDWVENCTVIAECPSGDFHLLKWEEKLSGLKPLSSIMFSISQSNEIEPTKPQQGDRHVA